MGLGARAENFSSKEISSAKYKTLMQDIQCHCYFQFACADVGKILCPGNLWHRLSVGMLRRPFLKGFKQTWC